MTRNSTVLASFEHLGEIVTHHYGLAFVWPDEGEFDRFKRWQFNDDHADFEPLWIDPTTAALMVKVHGLLQKTTNREKFVRMISAGRGQFGKMVEFCWSRTKTWSK